MRAETRGAFPPTAPAAKYSFRFPENPTGFGTDAPGRQLPRYLSLPAPADGSGQVVVATGDVFLDFDSSRLRFGKRGITAIGCFADPKLASAHGVFCPAPDGEVRRFLQKPSVEDQEKLGAVDRHGRSVLDIGIMSLDTAAAGRIVASCHPKPESSGRLVWSGRGCQSHPGAGARFLPRNLLRHGPGYGPEKLRRGSPKNRFCLEGWRIESSLRRLFPDSLLRRNRSELYLPSFRDHASADGERSRPHQPRQGRIELFTPRSFSTPRSHLTAPSSGRTPGSRGAGCERPSLGGENIVAGVDIDELLALPQRACLDVLEGKDGSGKKAWFVRCYDIDDHFHLPRDGAAG